MKRGTLLDTNNHADTEIDVVVFFEDGNINNPISGVYSPDWEICYNELIDREFGSASIYLR